MKLSDGVNKRALILINVILGQTFLVIFSVWMQRLWFTNKSFFARSLGQEGFSMMFTILAAILTLFGVYSIREVLRLSEKEAEAEANAVRLQESNEFVEVLRSHRHDFLNHLQVISGMLDLGKADSAKKYVMDLAVDLKATRTLQLIDRPEINALLIKKLALAESLGVKLELDIKTQLAKLDIPPYDATRILGNLVENAIQASAGEKESERLVKVGIYETDDEWIFMVFNKRPVIPQDIQEKIFQRGFTTKGTKGSGLGLDIVATLLRRYNGSVSLISREGEGTRFTVLIPKQISA